MAEVLVRLEDKVKQDFQIYCIKNDTSMQEILSNHIKKIVAESKQRRKR